MSTAPPNISSRAETSAQTKHAHSEALLAYDEMIRLTPPDWLVKDVLPQGATAVLFGESNSFKSFIAIDLACCVALGVPWHGHPVKQGNVIYVASEAAYGVATKRIPAWMAHHKIPPAKRRGIFLRVVPPLLDDRQSLATFKTDIASVEPVALIVYDVLAGTMKGSEKETDVIAAWVRVVGEIETKFQMLATFRHAFALWRCGPHARRHASVGLVRDAAESRRRPRTAHHRLERRTAQGSR